MLTPQTVGILTSLPTPLALSLSVYILTLGFTSRNSLLRPLGLIPMISCALLAMHTVRAADKSINPLYTSIFSGGCTGMVLQYLDSVMLSRWTYEAQGPTSALGGQKLLRASKVPIEPKKDRHPNAFFSRLRFGWDEAFRCRSPRSPWEVKHVPRFFPDRPDREPSKTEFLYMMTKEFFVSVLFLDILSLMGRDVSGNPAKFASSEIPLFTRLPSLSAEVVILRLVSSVMHWVVTAFLLQVMYDAAAIAVVLFDFGRVERWPPLFNSWVECWSIRQFWGTFWHQGARQRFLAPSNFLSFSVFKLARGTLVARYTVLVLTFVISGLFHRFGDMAVGTPWQESGAFRFFVMQAVGIIIEDAAQGLFRRLQGLKRSSVGRPTGWKRALGSSWLLFWLFWTTPDWNYPIAKRSTGQGMLPFTLLGWFI